MNNAKTFLESAIAAHLDHYKEGLAQRAQMIPRPIGDTPEIREQQRGWDMQHSILQGNGSPDVQMPKEDCPLETRFERVGDAMAYLENEGLADTFNTTEGHAIACYQSNDEPGGNPNATIYEGCNGVQVEYHPELVARLRS